VYRFQVYSKVILLHIYIIYIHTHSVIYIFIYIYIYIYIYVLVVIVQSLSHIQLCHPWIASLQASLSFTISQGLVKFISNESGMLSNHLILCRRLLLLPSIFPSIRGLSQSAGSSHQEAKVLELQHKSYQWIFRIDFL